MELTLEQRKQIFILIRDTLINLKADVTRIKGDSYFYEQAEEATFLSLGYFCREANDRVVAILERQ